MSTSVTRSTSWVTPGAVLLFVATALAWWGWIGFQAIGPGRTDSPFQSWRLFGFAATVALLVVAASIARLPERIILVAPSAAIVCGIWIIMSRDAYQGVSTFVTALWFVGGILLLLGLIRFIRRFRAIRAGQ